MSKRRWFFLWLLFMGYLILGASIFYNIERDLEEERRREKHKRHIQLQGILEDHIVVQRNQKLNPIEREKSIDVLFSKLSDYCARPLQRGGPNATEEPYTWTFYNSFFFALTTLSTIGYGNLSPTSEHSKIWVILYSLIGIPFNGIVLAHLGEFFGSKILRAHHRYKNHVYESRLTLIRDILMYLIPGMAVFILAPSVIFKYLENWTFIDSIYYSFVSLTTIGYGDFVAGQTQGDDAYDVIYKIFLVFWIMFGLGYLVMILGFISRAMKSKKINKLEKKVAQTLKHTQSKIWNEFLNDVQYLRRILNEMYLMKVKPVYKEKTVGRIQLSQSCPNLSEWPVKRPQGQLEQDNEAKSGRPRRRRAFSENGQDEPRLPRVLSDGALGGIDVQATFSSAAFDPVFLPNPFGPALPQEDELSDSEDLKEGGGVNMFTDEEILSTEDYSNSRVSGDNAWFMGGMPLRRQGRAMSEAQVLPPQLGQQKTWAGAESLHQFALLKAMRAKSEWPLDEEKGLDKGPDSPARGLRRLSMAAINFFSPANKLKKKKFTSEVLKEPEKFQRPTYNGINAKHRLSLQDVDMNAMNEEMNYFTNVTEGRRPSILDLLATSSRNSESAISPVLEQTSIADFIRAVQSLKAMEAGLPTSPVLQRKQENFRTRPTGLAPFKGRFNERRYSQVPVRQSNQVAGLRPRAASIAPVLAGPVDRRLRKLSATPRGSPHSSGRATPIARVFPAPSLVVTSPDGKHKFSITNVDHQPPPPFKRADTLKDITSRFQ